MRLVLITMGIFLALALVLGFTLADLGVMVKKRTETSETEDGEENGVPVIAGIPDKPEAQVGTIKFLFKRFPESAVNHLGKFPKDSVVRALKELHGEEKNLRRRLIYLDLLDDHMNAEAAAYLKSVGKEGLPAERRFLKRIEELKKK